LLGREGRRAGLVSIAVAIVSAVERDPSFFDIGQSIVRDRHPVCVSADVLEDLL
jgi:hypothetical protein